MDKTAIQRIVVGYREARGNNKPLPFREFTEQLRCGIPHLSNLTFQAVANWESGANEPGLETLLYIFSLTNDWRRDFAADLMAAKAPGAWLPQGAIGRAILACRT